MLKVSCCLFKELCWLATQVVILNLKPEIYDHQSVKQSSCILLNLCLQIWDVSKLKRIRVMTGHAGRVGTQAWSSHMLSSGSRDKTILQRDVRVPDHFVSTLKGHKSEVCGLRVSKQCQRQLAMQQWVCLVVCGCAYMAYHSYTCWLCVRPQYASKYTEYGPILLV